LIALANTLAYHYTFALTHNYGSVVGRDKLDWFFCDARRPPVAAASPTPPCGENARDEFAKFWPGLAGPVTFSDVCSPCDLPLQRIGEFPCAT
jgi:hypothetical protein